MEQFRIHPAWINYVGLFFKAFIAFAAAMYVAFFAPPFMTDLMSDWSLVVNILAMLGTFFVLQAVILRYTSVYSFEDGVLSSQKGVIARNQTSMHVSKIRSINLQQSILERLLNVGNLQFISAAGGGEADVEFQGIDNPRAMKNKLQKLIDEMQDKE